MADVIAQAPLTALLPTLQQADAWRAALNTAMKAALA